MPHRLEKSKIAMARLSRYLRMDHQVLMHGFKDVKKLIIAVSPNLYGVYEPGQVFLNKLEMLYKRVIKAVFRITGLRPTK